MEMMDQERLELHLDQLQGMEVKEFTIQAKAAFLGEEEGYCWMDPVVCHIRAQRTSEEVILWCSATLSYSRHCSCCEEPLIQQLMVRDAVCTLDAHAVRHGIIDLAPLLREELLLELPLFSDCGDRCCPHRQSLTGCLKKQPAAEEQHYPFRHL